MADINTALERVAEQKAAGLAKGRLTRRRPAPAAVRARRSPRNLTRRGLMQSGFRLSRLYGNDLRGNAPKIRPSDVRLRTERIEDLPRSGDEGCGASRTKRANDIPRMRRHQSKTIDRKAKRVGGRLVRLGGWLEATHGIDRERAFEEGVQAGICQLLLHGGWRGVRQRDEPQPGIAHCLETVPHIGMCRKRQHALKDAAAVGS
jgi:hypothetical protein